MSSQKVVGYCRVSTHRQGLEGESIINQRDICNTFAQSKNLTITIFYEQKSGLLPPSARPELTKALDILHEGDIFFVKSRDRISRDPIVKGYIIGIITVEKKAVLVCGDDIDTADYMTQLCTNFINDVVSYQYTKDVSRKVLATIESRKSTCKQWTCSIPYGFIVDKDGNLFISLKQQEVLEEVIHLKSINTPITTIINLLNNRGIPRPSYNNKYLPWSRHCITSMKLNDNLKKSIIDKYGDLAIKDIDISLSRLS